MIGTDMKFNSKVDNWLFITLWGTVLLCVWAIYQMLAGFFTQEVHVIALMLFFVLVAASGIILPLLVLYRTYYVIKDDKLTVYGGFITWKIPLSSIRSVEPKRSWLSAPALSLDRLEIRYGRFGIVYVSPRDQEGFVNALKLNPTVDKAAQE